MMGPRQEAQVALFYEFSPENHVPQSLTEKARAPCKFAKILCVRAGISPEKRPFSHFLRSPFNQTCSFPFPFLDRGEQQVGLEAFSRTFRTTRHRAAQSSGDQTPSACVSRMIRNTP